MCVINRNQYKYIIETLIHIQTYKFYTRKSFIDCVRPGSYFGSKYFNHSSKIHQLSKTLPLVKDVLKEL